MKEVTIYTDGACSGNPGPGGWAAVLQYGSPPVEREMKGHDTETTNNRMELQAAAEALKA
ncbi:MAG TPA: ribonuclease HI, partial [Rhodothermales bacterium]|nr:ribonuclease HI [Rhodothermales bacterium]